MHFSFSLPHFASLSRSSHHDGLVLVGGLRSLGVPRGRVLPLQSHQVGVRVGRPDLGLGLVPALDRADGDRSRTRGRRNARLEMLLLLTLLLLPSVLDDVGKVRQLHVLLLVGGVLLGVGLDGLDLPGPLVLRGLAEAGEKDDGGREHAEGQRDGERDDEVELALGVGDG